MQTAVDYKCQACTATLKYNPETKNWKCEYCGTVYNFEDLEKNEQKYENAKVKRMDVDEYSCPNCGAQIVTDENTVATFCLYCGSTSIMKNRLLGVLQPDAVIPFKTTKEQAIEAFKKCKKGKLFAPADFAKKEQINKITGVYIPFWVYNCSSNGSIDCTGIIEKTWTSGDYRYTKTDTYHVVRGGNACFEGVPVDGSKKFDDATMDSIEPFKYEEFENFSPAYLSGFLAEKYDVGDEDAYTRAKVRIGNTFKDELKKDTKYTRLTVNSENININKNMAQYVLLPVWMLSVKYKNKTHLFAMNGQTGKMVGNIPISLGKAFIWWLGVFLGVFGIVELILWIL